MQLVRIPAGFCAALILIEFVEVDAFRVDFILVVVIVVNPFGNNMRVTFNATAREDTTLDSMD